MKRIILASILGFSLLLPVFIPSTEALAATWVNGYTKSNGTYVQGHYRSTADGNPYNNWSFPGNTNPYTGVTAGGSVNSYLNNYSNSSYSNSYVPTYYSPTTYSSSGSTYSSNYESISNGYKSYGIVFCDYGYYEKNDRCIKEPANGYSIGSTVFCDYGYVLSGTDSCVKKKSTQTSGYYSSTGYSSYASCPANSSESLTDSSKCTCDTGYEVNGSKTKCVKIPAKEVDKMCRDSFGRNSQWSREYSAGTPVCECKNKFEWNVGRTACVKEQK